MVAGPVAVVVVVIMVAHVVVVLMVVGECALRRVSQQREISVGARGGGQVTRPVVQHAYGTVLADAVRHLARVDP